MTFPLFLLSSLPPPLPPPYLSTIHLSIYLSSIIIFFPLNLVTFDTVNLLLLTLLFWPLWPHWLLGLPCPVLSFSTSFSSWLFFIELFSVGVLSSSELSLDNLDRSRGGSYYLYFVSFPYGSSVSVSLWGLHTHFQASLGFCHWVILQLSQILYV